MTIRSFFRLVEIQTKVASVIPFILGSIYSMFAFDNFKWKQALLFFFSMIIFDMTTTAINNYMDYKKAIKKQGFGYEEHNAMGKYGLEQKTVLKVIITMLLISTMLGITLFINTDITVLIVGITCFVIGISYSSGPIPISRTPFGEIFSGITMGFLITFLAVYIHIFEYDILNVSLSKEIINVSLNIQILVSIFIISIPTILGISNIMLANNICDMDEDIINRRYTLPIYIGKNNAIKIFKWSYYICYSSILLGVLLRILPVISLISLGTIVVVNRNIKSFENLQSKKETFVLSVKNFILISSVYLITILIKILI